MVNRFADFFPVACRVVGGLGEWVEELLSWLRVHQDERQFGNDISSKWAEAQLDLHFVVDDDAQVLFLRWVRDSAKRVGVAGVNASR